MGSIDSQVPPGTIIEHASNGTAPSGFLPCDGSSISTTTYVALFNALQYQWGGTGATFKVPDLRGRFTRMVDPTGANDPDHAARTPLGTGTTNQVGSVQGDQYASHTHDTQGNTGGFATGAAFVAFNLPGTSVEGSGVVIANGGNETRPKNAYVNKFIKY